VNTKRVNAAADVIARAMKDGRKFPAGVAVALESAQMLMSPEIATELEQLRTQVAGMANPPREVLLALYDGVAPELHTTVEAAREFCDDIARVDAHGKCWDWVVNEDGVHVQFWTHPDDDRPTGETSGTVTPIVVRGDEPLSELEQLRRDVESNRVDGQRLIRAEQRRAELEAVLDTHRKDDQAEIERLRNRVAELEAERHSTNEALDDAVQELRARREDEAAEVPPLTVFRASHDSIVMGLYATAAEARKHCETELLREWPNSLLDWIEDEEDGVAELVAETADGETTTGYVVTLLEVSSEYDEEADE
jgi:hypothetical protein